MIGRLCPRGGRLGVSSLLGALLIAASPMTAPRAADDCGAPVGGVVTCDAAHEVDSYQNADGITYTTVDLTIQHPGDGTPTEFIASGGIGSNFGDLSIFSSGAVHQTAVSDGVAQAGISAQSDDGSITIVTTGNGTVRTESDGVIGIFAWSQGVGADGVVTIDAGADIDSRGQGIVAISGGGAVHITSQAISTTGGGASGIDASSAGAGADGAITVLANGAISTLGTSAIGIFASSNDGPVQVTSQAISTQGGGANGIQALSGGLGANGQVTVLAEGAITTEGDGATGIDVFALTGGTSITAQAIGTKGGGAYGINSVTGGSGVDGTVMILVNGAVSTEGSGATGVNVDSADGPVTVTTQAVHTLGAGAGGILIGNGGSGGNGMVLLRADGAVATEGIGAVGIGVVAGGAIDIASQGVSTIGDGGTAIDADSSGTGADGLVKVVANGAVATQGSSSVGIDAMSAGGAVSVTSQDVSTKGSGANGILARSQGTGAFGAVTVLANGAISTESSGSSGISASSLHGAVDVTSQAISTLGVGSTAISASSGGVGADGAVTVLAQGAITTEDAGSLGIAVSATGAVDITSQAISTKGVGALGIAATSNGTGADGMVTVLVNGAISTAGDSARGLSAVSSGGPVSVTVQAVSTQGGGAIGINAASDGLGADGLVEVVALGSVSTLGGGATAIHADSAHGAVHVTSQAVSSASGSDAIIASSGGTGADGVVTVLANGAISAQGPTASGITAMSTGGAVDVTSLAVSTTGSASEAIIASSDGIGADGVVTVLAKGTVSTLGGSGSTGILAHSSGGAVSVTSQAVSTAGPNSTGISASSNGAGADGAVTLLAQGTVTTLGDSANGINARSDGGPVAVTATQVLASGEDSIAVRAISDSGAVTIALDVAQGGWADGVGVNFGSDTAAVDSSLTVNGGGSLGALSELAVKGRIGNETLLLSGHAVGQMSFDDGDDTLRILPGGQYDLRNFADSDGDGVRDTTGDAVLDLGAGASDQVLVQANGVLALGIAAGDDIGRIVGAESFINAGVVSLADQSVGGSAPDAGDRLWTDGPYQGSGGLLRLDARLDAGGPGLQLTDRFLVDGSVTGTTGVKIYNDMGQVGPTGSGNTAGISIVQVAGTAAADSFALAKPLTAGAWEYEIVAFDPGSSDAGEKDALLGGGAFWDYRLQSSFFTGVYEYAAVMQGPGLLGQAALEGALNRPDAPPAIASPNQDQSAALGAGDVQEGVRPTAGDGVATGAWFAAFGQGLDVSSGNGLTFGQDNYGLQAGYDLAGWRGVFGGDDSLVLGAFGTLAEGKVSFNNSASTVDISLYGGGAYAAYGDGGFRADLVAQVLTGDADYVAPYPSVDSSLDVTTVGLGAGASWRFDLGRVFVTPGAELRYVHAWGEDFQDGSDVTIGLSDTDSLVARGRIKAGMGFDNVAPYLSVGVAHEFLGEASATASGLTFNSSVEGTAFEVGGGIAAWALASNLSISLDAGYRFGDEVEGFTVSGGFKLSW